MIDPNKVIADPYVQQLIKIMSASQQALDYIRARDYSVIDPEKRDAEGNPTVVRPLPTKAEKMNLIHSLNHRVDTICLLSKKLKRLDYHQFINIGTKK